MVTDAQMLNHIYQSTQMGREGIISVLRHADEHALRTALEQQLAEYDLMNHTAKKMLRERRLTPEELNPFARVSSQVVSAAKTMADHSSSKIAEMMIQGNTMGVTKDIQHLNDYQHGDGEVRSLAEKLLATEQSNIEQMKKFL